MTLIPAIVLAFQSPDAQAIFKACQDAHAKLYKARLSLDVVQKLGQTTRIKYDLSYLRPDHVLVRIREPEQNGKASTDRTFFVAGSKVVAYDAMVHERLTRTIGKRGSLADRLSEVFGGRIDDAVACFIDSAHLAGFLNAFKNSGAWNVAKSGPAIVLSKRGRAGNEKNSATFRFEASSKLLKGLKMTIPNGTLEWVVFYSSPPKTLSYSPPSDAVPVTSFSSRAPSPIYQDKKTRSIAERSMAAYDKLRYVAFRAIGQRGETKAWLSGPWVREETDAVTYVWDRKTATILDTKRRACYTGKASSSSLVDALAAIGSRMDPVIRQIVTRQNPIRVMLTPGMKISYVSSVPTRGVPSDLIEFRSGRGFVLMAIRKDNGLLASVRTTVQDKKGAVVSDGLKNYSYNSVGKPIDKSVFKLQKPTGFGQAPIQSLLK